MLSSYPAYLPTHALREQLVPYLFGFVSLKLY